MPYTTECYSPAQKLGLWGRRFHDPSSERWAQWRRLCSFSMLCRPLALGRLWLHSHRISGLNSSVKRSATHSACVLLEWHTLILNSSSQVLWTQRPRNIKTCYMEVTCQPRHAFHEPPGVAHGARIRQRSVSVYYLCIAFFYFRFFWNNESNKNCSYFFLWGRVFQYRPDVFQMHDPPALAYLVLRSQLCGPTPSSQLLTLPESRTGFTHPQKTSHAQDVLTKQSKGAGLNPSLATVASSPITVGNTFLIISLPPLVCEYLFICSPVEATARFHCACWT